VATTRSALRQAIDEHLRLVHGSSTISDTATGGTTSTLVDTSRTESDDYWNNTWLYISDTTDDAAPKDEESLVASYSASDHTFNLSNPFTAAPESGDTYELRRYFSAAMIHSAINLAVEEAQYLFPNLSENDTLVIEENTYDYTIPTGVEHILKVEWLEHDIDYRGTATGGSADTLEDTDQSWDTDALADMEIAIYEGTGSGQYRTISSNTSDTITVSTNWATNPDSTSKYVIKDLAEPCYRHRVTHVSMTGSTLHLHQYMPRGQRLSITYVPTHTDLTTDASTTTVPKTYVVLRAIQHLMLMAPSILPDTMQDQALRLHDRLELQVQRFLAFSRRTEGQGTLWNRGGAQRSHWYRGGTRAGIGLKEEI